MPDHPKIYAVLTGDIVSSTKLDGVEMHNIRTTFIEATTQLRLHDPDDKLFMPEFSRGDEWQLLLDKPGQALRVALYLGAILYAKTGVRTKIAIGIGRAEELDLQSVAHSNGEAFVLSGRALDNMNRYFDLTSALPTRSGPMADWVSASLHLCSSIARSWTKRQAEIVGLAIQLQGATHSQIATALTPARTQQTVTRILQSANWRGLHELIEQFDNTDWQGLLQSAHSETDETRC